MSRKSEVAKYIPYTPFNKCSNKRFRNSKHKHKPKQLSLQHLHKSLPYNNKRLRA